MTDIEDLWSSLPTGEPPTSEILRRGREAARPWRAVRRPLFLVGAAAALGGTFFAGTLVGASPPGDGASSGQVRSPGPAAISPVAFQADLAPAPSCDALLSTYVDRALGRVTAWGWQSPFYYKGPFGPFASPDVNARAAANGLATRRVTASATGTNVQERQVDEPDTVKTDGSLLVRVRDSDLLTYDVTGPSVKLLSTLPLHGFDSAEILLSGDTVVVIGADSRSERSTLTGHRTGSRVQTVSLADPSAPQVTSNVTYGAAVTSARQAGSSIHLVLSTGLPNLPFVHPHKGLSQRAATIRNRRVVRHSTISDWLPGYSAGNGRQDLLDCKNIAVPPPAVGLDTVAVVTFSVTTPTTVQAFGLAGATTIAYESVDSLYLVSTPASSWPCYTCLDIFRGPGSAYPGSGSSNGTSYIFQFKLSGTKAVEVASGQVEGTIRDRWSMDEANGQLRVLVGPSSETGNFNSIVTFERRGTRLVETGRLDHIGRGEDIESVRWQDDLALVVTYRQVDPLYVVDLSRKPRIISRLKVSGYSSYLHPLGPNRLIGVGQGPGPDGWGAQMGLFDVRDLNHVRRLDVTHYPRGSVPVAGSDPRAFTWLPDHRVVITVVQHGRVGLLSIQHLYGNRLHNRMLTVEYGTDIAQVRTIELPDRRVVLVTGEKVRFLDV